MSDKEPNQFEIEELDDKALEGIAGGADMELLPDIDAINCKDNTTCPNNGCSSGCNPNTVAGCTVSRPRRGSRVAIPFRLATRCPFLR